MIVVTGGAGFIGSNYVHSLLQYTDEMQIVNLDKMTYAASRQSLPTSPRHVHLTGDINDRQFIDFVIKNKPHTIVHFAAETHVDNSIKDPSRFMLANANGTFSLLESIREHSPDSLLIHVSTDEVYGALTENDLPFTETTPYNPSSPYSASKAASDHLVNAWSKTFGLKAIIAHCSNNYGPRQHQEKFIPTVIVSALLEKQIPIYGNGKQIRDWLHVDDTCSALRLLAKSGTPGEVYNIGSNNEHSNVSVAHKICLILDRVKPRSNKRSYAELIEFVSDRPGHDYRYAIDNSKIKALGWQPTRNFDTELENLVKLYCRP